jgi:hypothetical protein
VEPVSVERIQRMIDAEAAECFPAGVAPRLVLLRYGDDPGIEPGELYLRVILGQDHARRDEWIAEHFDRLEEFRMRRLPEVKGFVLTTEEREAAGLGPTGIMKMDGISMFDPEEDAVARGLAARSGRAPGDARRAHFLGPRDQPRRGYPLGPGPHP